MKRILFIALFVVFIATALALKAYASYTDRQIEEALQQSSQIEKRSALEIDDIRDARKNPSPEIAPPEEEDEAPLPQTAPEEEEEHIVPSPDAPLICIDAGHQRRGNPDPETLAPSSTQTKAKVASGTRGISTGIDEYVFTLRFSMLLKDKLEGAGYRVGLVREEHDVDISNQERAEIANSMHADLYLRIHGNGSSDPSISGIETYYPSADNPDIGHLSAPSARLSSLLLEEMAKTSGAKARGAFARDDLTGTNFAKMPSSLVECGYMTHPEEDLRLNDEAHLNALADGIVSGLHRYFHES